MFGPVRMCSDAFGCNRIHFGALGCVQTLPEKFGFFGKFGVLFGQFKLGGCTFPGVLRARGVLLSGCTSRSLHYFINIQFLVVRMGAPVQNPFEDSCRGRCGRRIL